MPYALDALVRKEDRETEYIKVGEAEPTLEMWWALSQAKTFFIPKGRLQRSIIRHLSNCEIAAPRNFAGVGEVSYCGRTFVFAPDAEIADYYRDTPNAIGFTATHQLTEREEAPAGYAQQLLTLWNSRFSLACRAGEAEQVSDSMVAGELQLACTEYYKTFEYLCGIYDLPTKMEKVNRGCAELTLRRRPEFSLAGVITETEVSVENCGLEILFDYMAPVEVTAMSNVPLP